MTDETPTAPVTGIGSLRARREKAREALTLDLVVPRYDPPIYVRLKPVTQARIEAGLKQAEKSKAKDASLAANAALIATACVGIFEKDGDTDVSIDADDRHGDLLTFSDERTAELLEVPMTKAGDLVRALYLTEGDVMATAGKLVDWCGYSDADLEADFSGN